MSADNKILIVSYREANRCANVGGDALYEHFNPNTEGISYTYVYMTMKDKEPFIRYGDALDYAGLLDEDLGGTEYGLQTLCLDYTWDEIRELAVEEANKDLEYLNTTVGERNAIWYNDPDWIDAIAQLTIDKK